MISRIQVGENEVQLYKQEAYIPAGTYFRFLGSRPSEQTKKSLSLRACSRGREFLWLAPYEEWVKRFVDGSLVFQPAINEQVNWSLIGVNPNQLRNWQKALVTEVYNYLRQGLSYRKGWVAPLGAGKTLGGLLVAQLFEPKEVAVLARRYLHETWRSESAEWGLPCPTLCTYESAHKLPEGVKCLIIDEILAYKNPDAQRSQKAQAISIGAEVVVGFTGIMVAGGNLPDLRWLRVVKPGCVPADEKAWQFRWGLDTVLKEVGPNKAYVTNEYDKPAVAKFVAPYIEMVDISEISAELPEITYSYIECDPPGEYEAIQAGAATTRGIHKRLAQVLQSTDGFIYNDEERPVRFMSPKMYAVKEWVEELGEPVVLVCNWTDAIDQLAEALQMHWPAVLTGSTKDPGAEIARFKSGHTQVLIVNAGFSQGMNLQKCCRIVAFLSVSSRPDDYEQMIGRVYRPGQKNAVQIVHFVCRGTMDKRRIELVQKHRDVSAEMIERMLLNELEGIDSKRAQDKS